MDGTSIDIDFYKTNVDYHKPAEAASYISSEFGDESDNEDGGDDAVFDNIKKSVVSGASEKDLVYGDGSVVTRDRTGNDVTSIHAGAHNSLVFGFIPKGCYTHPIKNGALLGSK